MHRSQHLATLAVVAILFVLPWPAPRPALAAQSGADGVVRDARGRPVAGAVVTLKPVRGGSTQARTGAGGEFRFMAQRPGMFYTLLVESPGYRSVQYDGLRLESGRVRTIDVRLKKPGDRDVVVLLSRDPFPFEDLLRGLLASLDAPVRTYDLDADPRPEEIVRRVRDEHPNLILGIGLKTAHLVRREIREIPAVLSLLDDPRRHDLQAVNLSFVATNPPPEELVRKIHAFVPGARVIGLVFDARDSTLVARDVGRAARGAGLRVVMRPVYSATGLERTLASLAGQIDVLAVPFDRVTVEPRAIDAVTGWALRNRVPLAAPGPDWVRRGALFSYGATPETIGQDLAYLASQILFADRQPSEMPFKSPAAPFLALNETTALALGVNVPPDVRVDASY